MVVVIKKRPIQDGMTYEIDDFDAYAAELKRIGVVVPNAKYRIFISTITAQDIATTGADIEAQIALFFRLGSAAGIEYEFRAL